MKTVVIMLISFLILYLIFQAFYSGSFMTKSARLIAKPVVKSKTLGEAKNPPLKLFIDGDSVGVGVGSSSFEKSLAGRVAAEIAKRYHVEMINNSVSGSKMYMLAGKLIPSEKQDITLLVISSNDLFHFSNLDEFRKSTKKVLEKYSKISKKVVIIGPGRVFDAKAIPIFIKPVYKHRSHEYANIISEVAKNYINIIHVNPIEAHVEKSQYGDMNAIDGFHPNDEGYRFWFDLIKPHLRK